MTRIRIEGCAWHQKNAKSEVESQENHQTHFARCMRQRQALSDTPEHSKSQFAVRQTCYRIVGGLADGVVFELNEAQGELRIRLLVPQFPLYHLWSTMTASWTAKLQSLGLSVSLEVIYVAASA